MKDPTDLTNVKVIPRFFHMEWPIESSEIISRYKIDLNKHEDFVYVSFASFKRLIEKAKTTGERIYEDLSVEDWIETISDVMNIHNPNHARLVMDFQKKRIS